MKSIPVIATLFVAGGMVVGTLILTGTYEADHIEADNEDNEDNEGAVDGTLLIESLRSSFDLREWSVTEHNLAGDPDAPVVMVQFSDYACDDCFKFWKDVIPKIKENFIDKGLVRYVYNDFTVHGGQRAAEAAWCAAEQGAFWQYHDVVFSRYEMDRQRWGLPETHESYSEALGLNTQRFMKCFKDRSMRPYVEDANRKAAGIGVQGVPFFFINEKVIPGYSEYELFKEVIDNEIREILAE